MSKLNFRTSSGIKSIVGRDLITDKFVAIFELVKNGYDAKAKNVLVSFNNTEYLQDINDLLSESKENSDDEDPKEKTVEEELELKDDEPHLIISDDGHGMNKDDLINKWLYLAYSDKKEGSKNEDRAFVGSKGIGRFSCDTLGETLNIRTKKADENIEHILIVKWANFDEDLKTEFEDIDVRYGSRTVDSNESYTTLTIRKLRHDTWNQEDELNRAKRALERLKNPFKGDDGFNIYIGKHLSLTQPDPQTRIFNNISEIIRDRTTTIEAIVGDTIEIELYDRGETIYKASKKNGTILKNTPIAISIHYLNPSAKAMFTRRMGIRPVDYGNIFIYKNGFRVMPYGDEDYDLFGLNLRKTQGHSRYIATREVLGYIDIQDQYHYFKEASSRNNGFIENAYFNALEILYKEDIHRLLEHYIRLIQWGEIYETGEELFFNIADKSELELYKNYISSYKDFEIEYFKDDLDIEENNPEKKIEKIINVLDSDEDKKAAREVKRRFTELKTEGQKKSAELTKHKEKEERLNKQIENLSIQRSKTSYEEQISHHFTAMSERLRHATRKIMPFLQKLPKEDKDKALIEINKIRTTQNELDMFRSLLIKTNYDMRSNQPINWYEQALWFVDEKKQNVCTVQVSCSIADENYIDEWIISSDVLQFQMALENFYQNARDHKASYIDIIFYKNQIVISNDSENINDEDIEKIKELGYSTKKNGTGIGLYQIDSFFKRNKYHLSISQEKDVVSFVIQKDS